MNSFVVSRTVAASEIYSRASREKRNFIFCLMSLLTLFWPFSIMKITESGGGIPSIKRPQTVMALVVG